MVTRSILGRILVIAVLVSSLGVIGHAALLWSSGGKGTTRKAAVVSPPSSGTRGDAGTIRVVYPGVSGAGDPSPPKAVAQVPSAASFPETPPSATPPLPAPATAAVPATPPPAAQAVSAQPQSSPPSPLPDPATTRTAADSAEGTAATDPAAVKAIAADPPVPSQNPRPGRSEPNGDEPVPKAAPNGAVDINHASIEALDRLGGGRIGQTIARHRPYSSVEDLVRRRVLRRSVYDHIRGQIATE